jgi:hypothetical protein
VPGGVVVGGVVPGGVVTGGMAPGGLVVGCAIALFAAAPSTNPHRVTDRYLMMLSLRIR